MKLNAELGTALASGEFTDAAVRIGLIALLVVLCYRIFNPFMGLMVWALILAVCFYPVHQRLTRILGGRQGVAATLIVIVGVLLIGLPLVMLGESFAVYMIEMKDAYEANTLAVPQPAPSVAEWPLIGERVYELWQAAAANLPAFLENNRTMVEAVGGRIVSGAATTASGALLFLAALIVASIMMAWGEPGSAVVRRILIRISGPDKGPSLQKLSTLTVRSVAAGVIGVAFIQALILGVGFIFSGVPGAGVLAVIVMLLGILQLPALLVSLPVIVYLWMGGDASTTSNTIWSIYLLIGGAADNVLKPLLLGRGVDVPMPIILLGAIGGMVSAGIVGLFIGAVLLAVGYEIFMDWVGDQEEQDLAATEEVTDAG